MKHLNLAQQFMFASLIVLVSSMFFVGWWVGKQIQIGVINQTAATTALYVDSFVASHLQELGHTGSLAQKHIEGLSQLLQDTPLGQYIVAFKIWDDQGRVLYSTNPSIIGRVFPIQERLARAWRGEVVAKISDLQREENIEERRRWPRLLEIYSPVRLQGTNQIVAVAEFYQTVTDLESELNVAQRHSWLVVGAVTLTLYLLLAGIVRRGNDTIERQQAELQDKVSQLTTLLAQNKALHERVQRAARRATALNERFLRRISAELHDGPAQILSLALLRLDNVVARCPVPLPASGNRRFCQEDLHMIQTSLRQALEEMRSIASGLRLPELENRTLTETIARVVRIHERRTETKVMLTMQDLPEQVPLPLKITLYRLIQEGLNNAYRHGGGIDQQVRVSYNETGYLRVEVSDRGPGFQWAEVTEQEGHLGLVSMRERVESLGGRFAIETAPEQGTKVIASLPFFEGR